MELEKDTLNSLVSYLKKHGYPDKSLAVEYQIGKYRVDLAVIDTKTNLPIQIFEIKSKNDKQHIGVGKMQIGNYLSILKMYDLPAYLVFPKESDPYFEAQRVNLEEDNKQFFKAVESYGIFDYEKQKQSRIGEKINETNIKRNKTETLFGIICWSIAGLLLLLFVFMKVSKFTIESTELAILGAAIALVIIPYAGKLKILGIEFERLQKELE